jgi:hypothetical protein
MAAATAESSVGKKVTYYPIYQSMGARPPESRIHRTMNNFATLISCTTASRTFLEMYVTNINSLICHQEKVSQQCTFHLHQSNIPLLKCTEHCDCNKHSRHIHKCFGKLNMGKLEWKSVSIRDTCIRPHNFVHNLHLKATWNTVLQLH